MAARDFRVGPEGDLRLNDGHFDAVLVCTHPKRF